PFNDPDTTDEGSGPVTVGPINKPGQYIQRFRFFDPVGARADIDNVQITFADVTLPQLLNDALPAPTVNEGEINLQFNPNMAVKYNLDDAAALGKFNHFNWFQTIDLLEGAPPTRGIGPDPLVGGNLPLFDPADDYPWYWDEVNSSNGLVD